MGPGAGAGSGAAWQPAKPVSNRKQQESKAFMAAKVVVLVANGRALRPFSSRGRAKTFLAAITPFFQVRISPNSHQK